MRSSGPARRGPSESRQPSADSPASQPQPYRPPPPTPLPHPSAWPPVSSPPASPPPTPPLAVRFGRSQPRLRPAGQQSALGRNRGGRQPQSAYPPSTPPCRG